MLREKQKHEAIRRMIVIGLFKDVKKDFIRNDRVCLSQPPMGAYFWLDKEELDRVKEFEKQYDALVYHVIKSYTQYGIMESYFYVSKHQEEWEMDINDLMFNRQVVYVNNLDNPELSEFGTIEFKLTPAQGLIRTY